MKTGGSEISAAFSNAYVKLDLPGRTVGPGDAKYCSQIPPINDLLNIKVSLSGEMVGPLKGSHLQESLPSFGRLVGDCGTLASLFSCLLPGCTVSIGRVAWLQTQIK